MEQIWMFYNIVRRCNLSLKNVQMDVDLRLIWGNKNMHCDFHDGELDPSILCTGKYKESSFEKLKLDFIKPTARGGAVYLVIPRESVNVKVMKDYMKEKKSGLYACFKPSENANVC